MTMTNDQLRALAEALEPMAKAPRFEDLDVPGFCAYLRACADAQPVAWLYYSKHASQPFTTTCPPNTWGPNADDDRKTAVALYTHPAPAVPTGDYSANGEPLYTPPAVPAGWKWVPVEPTREMIDAAAHHHEGEAYLPFSLYKSMLAAAPAAPQAEPTREPLSEWRIGELHRQWLANPETVTIADLMRAVEHAHGIGGSND